MAINQDKLNPVDRVFHSASTFICTPPQGRRKQVCAWAHLRKVVTDGGFFPLRRAAQTPFSLVYEARP